MNMHNLGFPTRQLAEPLDPEYVDEIERAVRADLLEQACKVMQVPGFYEQVAEASLKHLAGPEG